MKIIKYFFEFLIIILLLIIFYIIGFKLASNLGGIIGRLVGPLFRSKKNILSNINKAMPELDKKNTELIIKRMWENYGRILSEYLFIKDFRNSKLENFIEVEGQEILNKLKQSGEPVIFISGHFNNFELMAMQIEKSGIDLAAIYRPLNNIFLNKTMEKIRKNFICKKQIKKGISGLREILTFFKQNTSIAIMIDQRVTEGIKCNFFNKPAYTTTIPAQLIKKFNCPVVTVYIERKNKINFEITINKPIYFEKNDDLEKITNNLNLWLEKMISKNPEQWIWTHNRWKL